jgi:hypothetical protein
MIRKCCRKLDSMLVLSSIFPVVVTRYFLRAYQEGVAGANLAYLLEI